MKARLQGKPRSEVPRRVVNRRRLWTMRIVAIAFPFVAVGLVEVVMRGAGWYDIESEGNSLFAEGVEFFPEWDDDVTMPKPMHRARIFMLGGSTTQGFGVERPFDRLVEIQLQQTLPDRKWEVINGGVSAFGSHRVLEITRRACEFDPDMIVVYMGHNEFLEDIFYDPQGIIARVERAQTSARRFRVARCMADLLDIRSLKPRPKLQQHFFGNSHFPLIHSAEESQNRIRFMKSNIRAMIMLCREHDAKIVFIPAVPNLLAEPGNSLHGPGYQKHAARWDALFTQATREVIAGQWQAALTTINSLHKIDDEYAGSHYLKGLALLGLSRTDDARAALIEANRRDWRGDRNNPDVFRAIVASCKELNTPCIDLRDALDGRLLDEYQRLKKLDLFIDHCHPSEAGHQIIAEACVKAIRELITSAEATKPPPSD